MTLRFISLKLTRYSDSQSILTAYSRELGRVSLAVPAGQGRSAGRLRALTMPLGVVECQTERRPGREVLPMRQAVQGLALRSLHSDPVKQMMSMLIAEVLGVALQAGEPDRMLYDYIEGAIAYLDGADARQTANFHLCFLYQLGRHLGIEPDTSTYGPGRVLDMMDGCWRMTAPLHRHYLNPEESAAAYGVSRMNFGNIGAFRYNRTERNRILDGILDYYSLHYASMRGLRSLDIVRSLL